MSYDLPLFLESNSLEWDGLGYEFSSPPNIDLTAPAALDHGNPWVVFAAVLQRAKSGRFGAMPHLLGLIQSTDDYLLWNHCAELLGDAAPAALVETVSERLATHLFNAERPVRQIALGRIYRQSKQLSGVPVLLDMYLKSTDRRETGILQIYISELLEDELGVFAGCSTDSDEEFRALALARYEELRREFGTDRCPVLGGALFSVESLAKRLHAELTSPEPNETNVLRMRHHLEASTGLDCSSFYDNEDLQYLKATAVVEEFLQTSPGSRYEAGVRYFYGHRIPGG